MLRECHGSALAVTCSQERALANDIEQIYHFDAGSSGSKASDAKWIKSLQLKVESTKLSFLFSSLGEECDLTYDGLVSYFAYLDALARNGTAVLHVDTQANGRWNSNFEMPRYDCRGNISFATNVPEIEQLMTSWSWTGDKVVAPRATDDVNGRDFKNMFKKCHSLGDMHRLASV